MSKLQTDCLLLFAKYPQGGRVKTRLAQTLGEKKATLLYRRMLGKLLSQVDTPSRRYAVTLCYTPAAKKTAFQKEFSYPLPNPPPSRGRGGRNLTPLGGREGWGGPRRWEAQSEGNLGERLSNAFANAFQTRAKRVIVIGADCPDIDQAFIENAFRELTKKDLVIAPAKDGGYTLLGMRALHPQLFQEISWSSDKVLQQTLERARQIALSIATLPTLADIDTLEDYRAAKGSLFESL